MYIDGNPYTNFKGVNCKDGKFRVADPTEGTLDYAVIFQVAPATLTGDRKVYVCNSSGSMFVRGYDIIYGTTSFAGSSNIAVKTVATSSCSITGLTTTSWLFISPCTSAEVAGYVPMGAVCKTAGKALIMYRTLGATTAVKNVPINYILLNPQTS